MRNWGDAKNRKAPARLRWTVDSYSPEEWEEGEHIGTRTGIQRDGLRFYVADIDSHEVYQDAPRFLATVQHRLRPELWAKLATALSTGRRGRYIAFRSTRELSNGTIRDDDGRKAGEFLGQGRHVVYITPDRWLQHDYARIPILDDTETDELLAALNYQPTMRDPEPKRPQDTVVDDSDVAFWRAHISLLLDERGLPPGLQRGQTFDLITGAVPVTNESDARFICLRGFLFMGFTPAEAIVLAMHFCDWNRSGKDLYDDCARIVRKLTAVPNRWLTDYKISEASKQRAKLIGTSVNESRGDTNSASAQPAEPRGPGRPRCHPELKLLKHLQQDGIYGTFDDTNEMLAATLYQDVRTIKRWLVRLEQDGHIERRHAGRTRFIVLTPTEQGDTNSAPPAPAADSADTAPDRTPAQEISTREQPQQGTEETRVSSPPCAAPSLPGGGAANGASSGVAAASAAGTPKERAKRQISPADAVARAADLFGDDRRAALRWVQREYRLFCDVASRGKFLGMYGSELASRDVAVHDADAREIVEAQRWRCQSSMPMLFDPGGAHDYVEAWNGQRAPSYDELLGLLTAVIAVDLRHALPADVYKFHQDTPASERIRIAQTLATYTGQGATP